MWFADPPPNALVRYSRDSVHRASSWVSLVSNPPPARNATAYPACIAAPLASVDSSNTYFALCSGHTAPFDSSYAPIQAIADGHSPAKNAKSSAGITVAASAPDSAPNIVAATSAANAAARGSFTVGGYASRLAPFVTGAKSTVASHPCAAAAADVVVAKARLADAIVDSRVA